MNADMSEWLPNIKRFEVSFRLCDGNGRPYWANTAPALVDSQIESAEIEIGCPFPTDYRSFISLYSDGFLRSCRSSLGPRPGSFHGLRNDSCERLLTEWRRVKDFHPSVWIPVCDDLSTGGIVGLQLDGPQKGHVFWACFNDGGNESHIAATFAAFLLSLCFDDQ